jgi:hypothetical protein
LAFGQVAGFFLDSCILLPHSLESTDEACLNFLKMGKKCFVSQSVRDEVFELSTECFSVICTTLRYYLKPALEKSEIIQITNRDGKTVAKVFSEQKKRIIKEYPTKSNVRGELVGVIENYIANQIHSLKDGVSLSIDSLLADGLTELQKAKYNIEKPFKAIETIPIQPNTELTSLPSLNKLVGNPKDVIHLASAILYQFYLNQWVIFVTNDEKEILDNEAEIWENFALQCSKPSWAVDNYNAITKLKPPVEFYRSKLIPTQQQKEFAAIIEKVIGIRIIRKPFVMKQ